MLEDFIFQLFCGYDMRYIFKGTTVSVSHGHTLCDYLKIQIFPPLNHFDVSNTMTFRLLCKRKRNLLTLIRAVYIIESDPDMTGAWRDMKN